VGSTDEALGKNGKKGAGSNTVIQVTCMMEVRDTKFMEAQPCSGAWDGEGEA